jgi:L-2-hydroxyglutarate oxidase LhgO
MNGNAGEFRIAVIGAGVIGLAVAERLSKQYREIVLLEKNDSFGQETSSRNSEVIHGGIYYPPGSLKAVLCRDGNRLIYERCVREGIAHGRPGKIVVACTGGEEDDLFILQREAARNGVPLDLLTEGEIRKREPLVRARTGLFSSTTGIVDSHGLMRNLLFHGSERGVLPAFRAAVTAVHPDDGGYVLEVNDREYRLRTRVLINCAGLHASRIAALAGIDVAAKGYAVKYCKGSYFRSSPSPRLNHLVYPVPSGEREGLGIHATIDLAGRVRFGPDVEYVDRIDYAVDERKGTAFREAVRSYLPSIVEADLHADLSGIRPKLQGPGEPFRDFVIREESDSGLPGLINLIGIESPGLTASPAVAERVASLVESCL